MYTEKPTSITLSELNQLVASTIDITLPDEYWVEAELSDVREVRGHCYMELIEKDPRCNTPVARAQARCWASRWQLLRPMFERITGQRLHANMKVMLRVHAQFHVAYGFSWIVTDINPEYTMGDMARRRQEIVAQLKAEGVFDLQRDLQLSPFALSIAVVSSQGAAGYGDFVKQLADQGSAYAFNAELFAATMQGEGVERSVVGALNAIYNRRDEFDAVVIIRGGGATSDLSGFDTLSLAENVANFPLPIITGIGHDRDESILDMVAHTCVKTPTAAAQLLIDNVALTSTTIDTLCRRIAQSAIDRMEREKLRIAVVAQRLPAIAMQLTTQHKAMIDALSHRITLALTHRIGQEQTRIDTIWRQLADAAQHSVERQTMRLQLLSQRIEAENPERLLSKGYSITTYNGRVVRNAAQLPEGALVHTKVQHGEFTSEVKAVNK